ncbi:MAG: hypothetical protein H7246_03210 [Phycisphaerae bacterium]|nr:hypothetical protein [Saprospiraceae bacterium]
MNSREGDKKIMLDGGVLQSLLQQADKGKSIPRFSQDKICSIYSIGQYATLEGPPTPRFKLPTQG